LEDNASKRNSQPRPTPLIRPSSTFSLKGRKEARRAGDPALNPGVHPLTHHPKTNPTPIKETKPMPRKKLQTAPPPPPCQPRRQHWADAPEFERDFIRETLAGYDMFPSFRIREDGSFYARWELSELLVAILRHAQEVDGAPARCRDRQCRKGRCHMFIDEEGSGVCHGGIRMASIDRAGVVLSGVLAVFKHYCPAWFEYAAEKDAAARREQAAKDSAATAKGA